MLPDRSRQLLTAFVDGELTTRQRRLVARLLRRSAEARQLLEQLQEDASALRHLPRPQLEVDLTPGVLQSIAERRLSSPRGRLARISTNSSWASPLTSLAAAAAVLIVLGMASYYCFVVSFSQPTTKETAQQNTTPAPTPEPDQLGPSIALNNEKEQQTPAEKSSSATEQSIGNKPTEVVRKPEEKPSAATDDPPPDSRSREAPLTDRVEKFQLDRVSDLLPIVLKLSDLEQESKRKSLLAELQKDKNFRLELPCSHGTKAFERVQNAARSLDVELLIEKQAQDRIKMKWRTSYLIYLEDMTPDELTRFILQIGMDDRNKSATKKEAQFESLVLTRMTPQQRKELSTLLGDEPPSLTTIDPRKPLADQTAEQVAESLAGKGRALRPDSVKSTEKPAKHHALVLAINTTQLTPGSEELRRYFESRKTSRPGSICVLLVLRG